jgi:hypothetical protein
MELNNSQLRAYHEYFAILANIQRRCQMEGINIRAGPTQEKNRPR